MARRHWRARAGRNLSIHMPLMNFVALVVATPSRQEIAVSFSRPDSARPPAVPGASKGGIDILRSPREPFQITKAIAANRRGHRVTSSG